MLKDKLKIIKRCSKKLTKEVPHPLSRATIIKWSNLSDRAPLEKCIW